MSDRDAWNKAIIEEFRANEGRVGGRLLLLLHHTGAKTGLPRLSPLAYMMDGARYVLIASKGGAPTHPDWYYNLLSHPNVTVETGMETFEAVAKLASEPERTRLFDEMAARNPVFTTYKSKTTRTFPVFTLTRQS
ncbi:nitroreductase family deazaflavin-dependent oxidoreductase [Chloroflexi bacterium TSY]|uniref:nitroreductase/quinone reductase family protein n=1 Tax=Candidatus Entotheonella palauensis TaxID=93172 RepID=UPI000B7C5A0F|nr:nitroreductase/quinone reductase family protein [Candidatus Entotheonella palauensis]MBV7334546.1 nitroreductase family deazaflavin-dependent oxidoreductase [Chloroflexi bacterium TSY]